MSRLSQIFAAWMVAFLAFSLLLAHAVTEAEADADAQLQRPVKVRLSPLEAPDE